MTSIPKIYRKATLWDRFKYSWFYAHIMYRRVQTLNQSWVWVPRFGGTKAFAELLFLCDSLHGVSQPSMTAERLADFTLSVTEEAMDLLPQGTCVGPFGN